MTHRSLVFARSTVEEGKQQDQRRDEVAVEAGGPRRTVEAAQTK